MIRRTLKSLLLKRLKKNPAVALLGARQVGKTTLAKELSPLYYDCEQAGDRLKIDLEWEKIRTARPLVIFDEAQAWPELFVRLRGVIDEERKRNGRFLILGSVSPAMMREISESLTGRLSLCELTPLLAEELSPEQADALWQRGGYPDGGLLDPRHYPDWQRDYLTLLAQRDLPQWGLTAKPQVTQRLFQMLAALHGCPWNASQVGKSLGLNYHTVNSYLDFLESAFLIRRLPAFSRNVKKRVTKSPKIYWRDTGLLHALLGIRDIKTLLAQPWVGASWEGWVIEQILGFLKTRGIPFDGSYLRTKGQDEVDLILEFGNDRWAVEIKLTSRPDEGDLRKLNQMADLIGAKKRVLLSRTRETVDDGTAISTNLHELLRRLEGLLPVVRPGINSP